MNKKLNIVLVDDEQDSSELLKIQLEKYYPFIGQISTFSNPEVALLEIPKLAPDLVFLDIEMPTMNGFQLLEQLNPRNFKVIFVTAFNQYAIKAFRFNAIDYLSKPLEANELNEAIIKAIAAPAITEDQIRNGQKQMKGEAPKKIALHTQNGVSFIDLSDIVYVEASNNYSKLFMADSKQNTISKTLKDVQDVLEESHFLRIHRQYIININQVKGFNKTDSIITMNNNAELPVAKTQKDKLLEQYKAL